MINKIISKALREEELVKQEVFYLFKQKSADSVVRILEAASELRESRNRTIKLTSTVHLTNICKITPKCKYCGFASGTSRDGYYHPFFKSHQEILKAVQAVEKSGIPRVSCSGAHGYQGQHAVDASRIVKENTALELLVNVGTDLNRKSLEEMSEYGTDTICCNLETVNLQLFNHLKPGERLADRIKICNMIGEANLELSSGLLIGLGESYQDRVNHLFFLKELKNLGEIPIMGFNPYQGTPLENHPPCSLQEQMKTIAITRLMYPDLRITVPTPTIGPENVKFSLLAGADNLATVIPENYPSDVKGVGSPTYGNFKQVLSCVNKMGLTPEI